MEWEKETSLNGMNSVNLEGGMDGTARTQVGKFKRKGGCHWGRLRGRWGFDGLLNRIRKKEGGDWLRLAEDEAYNLDMIYPFPSPAHFSLLSLLK